MKNALFIFLLSSTVVFARIGESNIEIKQRYGGVQTRTATGTNTWTGAYVFKEYFVMVYFLDNKSEAETIKPIEARKISDDEREALLKSIAPGGEWKKDDSQFNFMASIWINATAHAVAYQKDSIRDSSTLIVTTMDFYNRMEAEKKAKDKSKADGF